MGTQNGYNQYDALEPKKSFSKKNKVNIHKFREEARNSGRLRNSFSIYNGGGSSKKLDSTNYTENTDGYALYKVTYDKTSTTVTEMADSGISLTETHGT